MAAAILEVIPSFFETCLKFPILIQHIVFGKFLVIREYCGAAHKSTALFIETWSKQHHTDWN